LKWGEGEEMLLSAPAPPIGGGSGGATGVIAAEGTVGEREKGSPSFRRELLTASTLQPRGPLLSPSPPPNRPRPPPPKVGAPALLPPPIPPPPRPPPQLKPPPPRSTLLVRRSALVVAAAAAVAGIAGIAVGLMVVGGLLTGLGGKTEEETGSCDDAADDAADDDDDVGADVGKEKEGLEPNDDGEEGNNAISSSNSGTGMVEEGCWEEASANISRSLCGELSSDPPCPFCCSFSCCCCCCCCCFCCRHH
jgi:hypothetical protein